MVHFGSFWPEEVHLGPFRSANRTLAIPGVDSTVLNLGNGQNTVSRVLFRRIELTEPH